MGVMVNKGRRGAKVIGFKRRELFGKRCDMLDYIADVE